MHTTETLSSRLEISLDLEFSLDMCSLGARLEINFFEMRSLRTRFRIEQEEEDSPENGTQIVGTGDLWSFSKELLITILLNIIWKNIFVKHSKARPIISRASLSSCDTDIVACIMSSSSHCRLFLAFHLLSLPLLVFWNTGKKKWI